MSGEPKALTEDVSAILRAAVRPGEDEGDAVSTLARASGASTRTIYRILGGDYRATMKLDLADRLLISVGAMLHEVRVQQADGSVVDYLDAD